MTKAEARQVIDALGLPEAQSRAARRTIVRGTASESLEVQQLASGDLLVRRTRPGHDGYQVFEDTIRPDGSKAVVQKAYDSAGNLVHHDPKGGTP
jgi:hypothetical protein